MKRSVDKAPDDDTATGTAAAEAADASPSPTAASIFGGGRARDEKVHAVESKPPPEEKKKRDRKKKDGKKGGGEGVAGKLATEGGAKAGAAAGGASAAQATEGSSAPEAAAGPAVEAGAAEAPAAEALAPAAGGATLAGAPVGKGGKGPKGKKADAGKGTKVLLSTTTHPSSLATCHCSHVYGWLWSAVLSRTTAKGKAVARAKGGRAKERVRKEATVNPKEREARGLKLRLGRPQPSLLLQKQQPSPRCPRKPRHLQNRRRLTGLLLSWATPTPTPTRLRKAE